MSLEIESTSLARLADLIERESGNPANGLPTVWHGEALGTSALRPPRVSHVALRLTTNNQSHVFALTRPAAQRLMQQLQETL